MCIVPAISGSARATTTCVFPLKVVNTLTTMPGQLKPVAFLDLNLLPSTWQRRAPSICTPEGWNASKRGVVPEHILSLGMRA